MNKPINMNAALPTKKNTPPSTLTSHIIAAISATVIISLVWIGTYYMHSTDAGGRALMLGIAVATSFLTITAIVYSIKSLVLSQNHINRLRDENRWKSLMIENIDDIIIVLNMFGQIFDYNPAFQRIMDFPNEEIYGKPMRRLLFPDTETELNNQNYILLEKFRNVFMGNEADFIYSTQPKKGKDKNTITFRMIPIFKDNELKNILVTGRIMPNDTLTNNFLVEESSSYIMDNDISSLYELSYRLTRNLEKWFSKGDIHLMQTALQEMLINALEHGNLEIDYEKKTTLMQSGKNYWEEIKRHCNSDHMKKRKIYIDYNLDKEKVRYTIHDDGKGFDWENYLSQDRKSLVSNMDLKYHGIGLYLAKNIFNISYNEKGNTVTLIKYFNKS